MSVLDLMKESPKHPQEKIGDYLDRILPTTCYACNTPVRRMSPDNGVCPQCRLNQISDEAYAIARCKGRTLVSRLLS